MNRGVEIHSYFFIALLHKYIHIEFSIQFKGDIQWL